MSLTCTRDVYSIWRVRKSRDRACCSLRCGRSGWVRLYFLAAIVAATSELGIVSSRPTQSAPAPPPAPPPLAGPTTSYDLDNVRLALDKVLEDTRRVIDAAPPPPGLSPPPPLTMQLGFVSDSGEVTVQVGTDGRCVSRWCPACCTLSDLMYYDC